MDAGIDPHRRRRHRLLGAEPRAQPRGARRAYELSSLCDIRSEALELGRAALPRRVTARSRFDEILEDDSSTQSAIATPVSNALTARHGRPRGRQARLRREAACNVVRRGPRPAWPRAERRGPRLDARPHVPLQPAGDGRSRNCIDAGELGEIYFVSSSRVNLGLHQPDVSVVWDLGPHDFSILRYWLDELPTRGLALSVALCVIPDDPGRRVHQPLGIRPGLLAHCRALLALAEQAAADGDRRLGEDGRVRRHLERAGADLRLRRDRCPTRRHSASTS